RGSGRCGDGAGSRAAHGDRDPGGAPGRVRPARGRGSPDRILEGAGQLCADQVQLLPRSDRGRAPGARLRAGGIQVPIYRPHSGADAARADQAEAQARPRLQPGRRACPGAPDLDLPGSAFAQVPRELAGRARAQGATPGGDPADMMPTIEQSLGNGRDLREDGAGQARSVDGLGPVLTAGYDVHEIWYRLLPLRPWSSLAVVSP